MNAKVFRIGIITILVFLIAFGGRPESAAAMDVAVVSDTSQTSLTNTLKTILTEVSSGISASQLTSMNLKEMVLDPIAWSMSKTLQQQLTGNLLKWLGGQLPGQNGQIPFVQNYSEYYQNVIDQVVGTYLFDNKAGDKNGQCNEERSNRVITSAYNSYVDARKKSQQGGALQCGSGTADSYDSSADRILGSFLACDDELCQYFETQKELQQRTQNAVANERQILNTTGGMLPQRACQSVTDANGQSQQNCGLTNPLYLLKDSVSFMLTQMPGLQLLNTDEFNEVVSNLMSNLTNQAMTGLNGVLGLSGNPNYSSNIFGADGTLSYVDALLQDDISLYQAQTASPIKEALKEEQNYASMLQGITTEITNIEKKLEENRRSFNPCFDMTLNDDLTKAKEEAALGTQVAATATSILTVLDQQYDAETDANKKQTIISTFVSYKEQGFFRTTYQNQEFKVMYVDVTFADMADKFRYNMALKRQSCGGSFDYEGVLNQSSDDTTLTDTGEDRPMR